MLLLSFTWECDYCWVFSIGSVWRK